MTEWRKIYTNIRLGGGDGFTFVTIPHITYPEEVAIEFIKRFLPVEKHDNDFAIRRALACPESAIRMYLCKTMSSTFCIGMGSRDQRTVFYIGARRPQDIFKLILKVPEADKTYTWASEIKFSVRVAEGDDYDPEKFKQGTLHRGMA